MWYHSCYLCVWATSTNWSSWIPSGLIPQLATCTIQGISDAFTWLPWQALERSLCYMVSLLCMCQPSFPDCWENYACPHTVDNIFLHKEPGYKTKSLYNMSCFRTAILKPIVAVLFGTAIAASLYMIGKCFYTFCVLLSCTIVHKIGYCSCKLVLTPANKPVINRHG